MMPVTPFLSRYAAALVAGATAATLFAALSPGTYYDLTQGRIADLPGGVPLTLQRIVGEGLMAAFFLLLGKEGWEALTRERGGLHGRRAILPLAGVVGGIAGAGLVWSLAAAAFGAAETATGAAGWTVPAGTDVVLAVAAGRLVFGPAHPALQVLLLIAVADSLIGLLLAGLAAPEALRPVWLLLSLAAALAGWLLLTRPAVSPHAREQDRARAGRLWLWAGLAVVCWAGVVLAGLPGALGALPLLPAMPPAARTFGLFAAAEDFLTDPLNRLARRLHAPLIPVVALFGFTHGALDPGAAGAETAVALAAAALGKPLGVALAMALATRALSAPLPTGVTPRDLGYVAVLAGLTFSVPALGGLALLPGGLAQEAARLGFALTIAVAPLALALSRR